MKNIIITSMFSLLLAFTACNNDQNIEDNEPVAVSFSSNLSTSQSKVSGSDGTTWDANDRIGVFMVENGTTTVSGTANDVYTTASGGTTNVYFSGGLFMPSTGAYDFISYYPYDFFASISGGLDIDVTDQSNLSNIDYMYAFTNNETFSNVGYDSSYPATIELPFKHRLAKLVFYIRAGDNITNEELQDMTIYIDKLDVTGTLALNSPGVSTITASSKDTLSILESKTISDPLSAKVFEGLIIPQPISGQTVYFQTNNTINDQTFSYVIPNDPSSPANPWYIFGGERFNFTVTVNRSSLVIEGNIDDWDDEDLSGTATAVSMNLN